MSLTNVGRDGVASSSVSVINTIHSQLPSNTFEQFSINILL